MQFWNSLAGRVKCRVISASLEHTINRISELCNISNLRTVDDLTATFWVCRSDLDSIMRICDHVEIIGRRGIFWSIQRLLYRPVLVVGLLLLFFVIFYLPTRVLFISVSGNKVVPDTLILDVAQNCGIRFGATREHVRSEKVKNMLLQSIPELQWACINTKGCVAEISVQERLLEKRNSSAGVENIIANRDGIITEITVYSGNPLCSVGQIVKEGQLLVSGYSDLGLVVKSGIANAEIIAETSRTISVVSIPPCSNKNKLSHVENRYSVIIGKKLINFYKDSGILPPGCGRINKIYNLTLPGGFRLPLSIVKEQILYHSTAIKEVVCDFSWMKDAADSAIQKQMVAGEIIKDMSTTQNDEGVCRLHVNYRCREMIAIAQKKELYAFNGKRN